MTKKVLIVEDQPDSRRLLQDILQRFHAYGVEVSVARDGTEAWDHIQKNKPDLILLDLMMPGMSGLDVCRAVKADPGLATAHIIVVSAKVQQEDRREAARAGADEFLTKPYDVNAVIERVQMALGVNLL
jgi:CheY-like chemotaxis protein